MCLSAYRSFLAKVETNEARWRENLYVPLRPRASCYILYRMKQFFLVGHALLSSAWMKRREKGLGETIDNYFRPSKKLPSMTKYHSTCTSDEQPQGCIRL